MSDKNYDCDDICKKLFENVINTSNEFLEKHGSDKRILLEKENKNKKERISNKDNEITRLKKLKNTLNNHKIRKN